jgi:hypothetical protein
MQPLHEIQAHFRDAVVYGDTNGISHALIGGRHPEKRLGIHQRNYQASLTDALLTKFPAAQWLLGTQVLTEAAGRFIREWPPYMPCIAEYGSEFPDFLGQSVPHLPYVRDFAILEWFVGKAATAVDQPSVDVKAFSEIDSLSDTVVTLQTSVHYLHLGWPIDELLTIYLSDSAPAQFELMPKDVWIEIRGSRGEFQVNRLTAEDFMFRQSLLQGFSIGEAAARVLDINDGFDPGRALASIVTSGLITANSPKQRGKISGHL